MRKLTRLMVGCAATICLTLLGYGQTASLPELRSIEPRGRHNLEAGSVARLARTGRLSLLTPGAAVSATTLPELDPPLAVGWDAERRELVLGVPSATEPGQYEVELNWTDESGQRLGEKFTLAVNELPRIAQGSLPPVVLLNGYTMNDGWLGLSNFVNSCPVSTSSPRSKGTFGQLEYQLTSIGAPVLFFDNCKECSNCTIEKLGFELSRFLSSWQYTDGSEIQEYDLIAHSMGGLIARSHLAGLLYSSVDSPLFSPPTKHKVRKLITIGTPHFGSFIAYSWGTQAPQMKPGSRLIWNLATWNQMQDDLRGVDALAIAGNGCDFYSTPYASDGVVSLSSASIGFAREDERTRIVPYVHSDLAGLLPSCRDVKGAIANVDNYSHQSWRIIESFLRNTNLWRGIGHSPSVDRWLGGFGGVLVTAKDNLDRSVLTIESVKTDSGVRLSPGPEDAPTYFHEYLLQTSAQGFTLNGSQRWTFDVPSGHTAAVLLKYGPSIGSVVSPVRGAGLTVIPGTTLTIYGGRFLARSASSRVYTDVGDLAISSWTDTQITVSFPAFYASTYPGLRKLTVANANGQHTFNIMVGASDPPLLSVSPSQLSFQGFVGNATLPAQTLAIRNLGGGTLIWSATSSTPWLAVSPLNGTAASTLNVTANVTGLLAGEYSASIRFTSPGLPDRTIPITLSLLQVTVPLTVDTRTVSLTTSQSEGPDLTRDLRLSSTKNLNFTVSVSTQSGGNWLSANPVQGTTPATVTVVADATALEPGEYAGRLVVASDGASNGPQVVDVTLTVAKSVSIDSIANEASLRPLLAAGARTIIRGRFPLTQVPEGSDACSADPSSVLPAALCGVKVSINGVDLPLLSVHSSSVRFLLPRDLGPAQLQVTVDDTLSATKAIEIIPAAPGLYRTETGLLAATNAEGTAHDLAAPILTDTEEHRSITIRATGAGLSSELSVPIGSPVPGDTTYQVPTPDTLSLDGVQLADGSVLSASVPPGTIGLWQYTIKLPELTPGRHKLEFCLWGQCDTAEIVTLDKLMYLPLVNPRSLSFQVVEGRALPPPQDVKIGFTYGGAVPWTATSDASWLSVAPDAGEGEGRLIVSIVPAAVPSPGNYTGQVIFKATDSATEPLAVNCLLTVKRASSSAYGNFDTPADNTSGADGNIAVAVVAREEAQGRDSNLGQAPAGNEVIPGTDLIDAESSPPSKPLSESILKQTVFFSPSRPEIRGKPED